MTPCVGDTGPFLHLHEIKHLPLLRLFSSLEIPQAVANELHQYGVGPAELEAAGLKVQVGTPVPEAFARVEAESAKLGLQDADRAVLALAVDRRAVTVLTDDLDLREASKRFGIIPVGTIGILFRSSATHHIDRPGLERAIRLLFDESTIHLSPAFRSYVLLRLRTLPE